MSIERAAIVGAGLMGHGIAEVAAIGGLLVRLHDVDEAQLRWARDRIEESLGRLVRSQRLTQGDADAALERLSFHAELMDACAEAEIVIEAIPEILSLKQELFGKMDAICAEATIFATNTSQFSITSLASVSGRPDRTCGMHFFNPPVVMNLVEIARAAQTSDATFQAVVQLAHRLGKETVACRDSQGFITSRLTAILMNEAIRLVEEGVAEPEEVDRACRLAFNHRMGPIETADLAGLDTTYRVLCELRDVLGERFRPAQLLRQMVLAGRYGRKTRLGFYSYEGQKTEGGLPSG